MIIEPSWKNLIPELNLTDQTIKLESSKPIALDLSAERHCIGYYELGASQRISCPFSRKIDEGKEPQCKDCYMKDASFVAKTGLGDSAKATELLRKRHAVYLSLFSEDIVKVGVSVWERREIRTKEQGAIACMFIAEADGMAVRSLERRIHNQLGFTEWVRLANKLKALGNLPDQEKCKSLLEEANQKVRDEIDSDLFIEPDFRYNLPSYSVDQSVYSLPIRQITKLSKGAKLGGVLRGLLGKAMLIEHDKNIYAIDMNLLSGYEMNVDFYSDFTDNYNGIEFNQIEIDRQPSLLDLI